MISMSKKTENVEIYVWTTAGLQRERQWETGRERGMAINEDNSIVWGKGHTTVISSVMEHAEDRIKILCYYIKFILVSE